MKLEHYFNSLQRVEGKIFDPIRKKWLFETKEEIVRQLVIQYLINELKYGKGRIAIEKTILLRKQTKRFDIVIYDQFIKPYILIECKSYEKNITNEAMHQIARYNLALNAPYLCVTNGIQALKAKVSFLENSVDIIDSLPVNLIKDF